MIDALQPLVLDFDRSVSKPESATRIDLQHWQESVRFGCPLKVYERFVRYLAPLMPARHGTVLMGSGDYHHVSRFVIVLDNHPDNMRFPFGIHCGSWVRGVALLPQVRHVHVVGICSSDIGARSAWSNYWLPLLRGRLTYWCLGVDVGWARRAGLGNAFRRYDEPDALLREFMDERDAVPVYLSIDKDVFAEDVVRTNWDQGRLAAGHALAVIESLAGRLIGSDITGEVSVWRYRTWWKRWLSALDDQPDIAPDRLAQWQEPQQQLNLRLLDALAQATHKTLAAQMERL